jgi:hypothetical protein
VTWAGSPFAHLIEFNTGLPIGDVTYTLIGNAGETLLDSSFTPETGALSHLLVIPGEQNNCAQPLLENRTLVFTYVTATGVVSDRVDYRVVKPIPFGASPEGVRAKLGVESHEVSDDEVDLVTAYAQLLTFGDPSDYETTGDRNTLIIIHAIEAIAALVILYTLQVKIAQREAGGTDQFQRYGKPDWLAIENDLHLHVARARALLDPEYDALGANYQAFTKVTPTPDVITGA